jgi:SAM-dependent methyltransferase
LEAIGCVGSKGFTDWISSRANPYYHDYQSKWVGLVPFLDGYFDKVIAEDVVEHLDNPVAVVQELGRVLKVGGTLWVRGPDADWVWHDITHKRAFTERTFDGFCPETYDGKHYGHYHGPVKFRMVEKRHFNHGWEYTLEKL